MKKNSIITGGIILVIIIAAAVYLLQPKDKPIDSDDKASVNKTEPTAPKVLPKQAIVADDEPAKIENSMAELEYQRNMNLMFEEEARETFPLLSVQTSNPIDIEKKVFGPKKGEIWIRIKPENSKEFKEIMAEIADLYKDVARYDDPVTIILWVGNRIWAKFQYPPQEEPDNNLS